MSTPTRYTRELLSELAANSTSVSEMIRKLGVPHAGGTHSYLSKRLKHYGIDISHFEQSRAQGPRQAYTRERLVAAAAVSCSFGAMIRNLGVVPYDSLYGYLRQRVEQFGIDTSHFVKDRYAMLLTKEEVEQAVTTQLSLAGVLRVLKLADTTSTRRQLKASIAQHGLDTSHFTGAGGHPPQARGASGPTPARRPALARPADPPGPAGARPPRHLPGLRHRPGVAGTTADP